MGTTDEGMFRGEARMPERLPDDIAEFQTTIMRAVPQTGLSVGVRLEELPADVRTRVVALTRPDAPPDRASDEQDLDDLVTLLETHEMPAVTRTAILGYTRELLARAAPVFEQDAVSLQSTVELSALQPKRPARGASLSGYTLAGIVVLFAFVCAQVLIIHADRTGPFLDESIYALAGIRTIEGHGLADSYLTWFAGSLLWPVGSGVAYVVAGLAGTRLLATLCVAGALLASWRAARTLVGEAAAFWALVALALSGPVLHLAHLAVYDALALTGTASAFWALARSGRTDGRRWLVVAALAFVVAVAAKYPIALCVLPLTGVLLATRRRSVRTDLFILVNLSVGALLIYVLPLRDELARFLAWRVATNPSFGVTPAMVRVSLVFEALPVALLAIVGWFVARNRRTLATVLLGGVFIWPAYHLFTNNSVSAEKHVVFGFLFGAPLLGLALAAPWAVRGPWRFVARAGAVVALAAFALVGIWQANVLDRGWADSRPAAAYLAAHVAPGERVLANDAAPYQVALYTAGDLVSPWDVYDGARIQQGQFNGSLCDADWFVDEGDGAIWPDDIRRQVEACGTFAPVYTTSGPVTALGRDLRFVTYPVTITVWLNLAKH